MAKVFLLLFLFSSPLYSVSRSNDLKIPDDLGGEKVFKEAEAFAAQGKWEQAFPLYLKLLEKDYGVIQVGKKLYRGSHVLAFERFQKLPQAAQREFEKLFGEKAKWLLKQALKKQVEEERHQALLHIGEAYFPSRAGQKARLLLANEKFLSGKFSQAARHYFPLLKQESFTHLPLSPFVILEKFLLSLSKKGSLSKQEFQEVVQVYKHLKNQFPKRQKIIESLFLQYLGIYCFVKVTLSPFGAREGRWLGETEQSIFLKTPSQRKVEIPKKKIASFQILHWTFLPSRGDSYRPNIWQDYSAPGGDNSHRNYTLFSFSLGKKKQGPLLFSRYGIRKKIYKQVYYYGRIRSFQVQSGEYVYPFFPALQKDWLYLSAPNRLIGLCLDPPGLSFQRKILYRPIYEENAEVLYATTLWDRFVYATFIVDPHFVRPERFRGIPIKEPVPLRRLFCFDRFSGKIQWVKDGRRDSFFKKTSLPVTPIVVGRRLYAIAYRLQGYIQNFVVALDGETGKTLWKRWIGSGSQETTMFGYYAREPLSTMLAEKDGILYCLTNQGVVAALRALDGKILWMRRYPILKIHAAQFYYPVWRPIEWANNPPLVAGDKLIVAPMDSKYFFVLNRFNGKLLWKQARKISSWQSIRYLVGVAKGILVTSGKDAFGYDLETGKLLWNTRLLGSAPRGKGIIAGDEVLLPRWEKPSRWNSSKGKYKIAILELEQGRYKKSVDLPSGIPNGNLIVTKDYVILVGENTLAVFSRRE